jgi:signal transduction histidine kinase
MLRDAGVRGKLFAVLAIPTVLLVVASGWLVGGQVQSARQAGQIEAVTDVAVQLNRVVHSLQLERTVTLDYLQGITAGGLSGVQGQRQYTNSQLKILRDKVAASPLDSMSASIQAATARATKAHSDLVGVRKSIDAGRLHTSQADLFYGNVISTDLQLPGTISVSASPKLAQRLLAEQALSTAIESASHERDLIELAFLDGTVNEAEFGQVSTLIAQQNQSLQDFQRSAPPELFAALDTELAAADITQLNKSRGHLSDFLKGREPDFDGSVDWQKAANPRIASMVATEGHLVTDIASTAAAIQSSEQLKAGIFGAGALFGLVLAILLALVLAQRITLPLRRLTLAAAEIGEELPHMVERMQTPGEGPGVVVEPIPVEGDDEIGRLAAAFNTVNEVTLRVAKEQAALRASIAEMFVNVARRNQVLLGRQLAQLDKMEAREENPDLLKNLFRLDHLATRMRRNAESLLVLAGIDSTRRLRQAMPLSDVIRTAVGEIEAYQRVDPSVADDPDVSGRYALSVAHLIAELIENATVFSNPDTRVVVASAMTGHGVDVTITDYGLGMSDEEIAQANESIANPPLAEIAVSQRLGLFVVGRIAARIGATASLRKGRTSGTVVTVGLPLDVFEGLQAEEPVTADHAVEVAGAADIAESADSAVSESLFDEPVRDDALVGSVPHFAPAAAAPETSVPIGDVALFNPSEHVLSRLPQVDVAALVADAQTEGKSYPIAAQGPAESGRRGLLPRRSRSGEPAEPTDGPPVEAALEVQAHLDEVVEDVAPVEVVPVEVVPSEVSPVEVSPVDDLVEVAEADLRDPDLPDADLADAVPVDADLADAASPEIVAGARRRGSFFQRRHQQTQSELPDPDDLPADEVVEELPFTAESLVDEGIFHDAEVVADASTVDDIVDDAPVVEAPPAALADEAVVDDAVVGVPVAQHVRRRRLFGRRQWVADEPVAEEPVAEEPVAEAVAELSLADESVVEGLIEAPAAEELFTPVFEPAAPEFAWPVVDEPVAVEPVVVEPVAVEPVVEEPVAFAPVVEEPVAVEENIDEPVADESTVDEPLDEAVAQEPRGRRGLFGRRQRGDVEAVAAEEPVAEPVEPQVEFVPVAEATPIVAPVAEPEPEPVPVAAVYFATAIDILPGRAMGRRGKHATPVPTYTPPPTPAAPVTTFTEAAPAAPVVEPRVPAPLPKRDLSAAAPSAPPLQAPPAEPAPGPIETSQFEQIPTQQFPVQEVPDEPAAVEHAPTEVDQPMVSATMSELDQLALNAELQKSALSELRSLYEPSRQGAAPAADAAGLIRRQRRAVEPVVESAPEAPARERDAVQVRGMLSGFRAGVERGRTATSEEPREADRGDSAVNSAPAADAAATNQTTD